MNDQNKTSIGSIISTVIIIGVIILGGLYFWGKRIDTERQNTQVTQDQNQQNINTNETASVSEALQIKTISNGSDLTSIETDLKNTNTANGTTGY